MQYFENNEQISNMLTITIGLSQSSALRTFFSLLIICKNSFDSELLLYANDAAVLLAQTKLNGLKIRSEKKYKKLARF